MSASSPHKSSQIEQALQEGRLSDAQSIIFHWLHKHFAALPQYPTRQHLRDPHLWLALANVVERTSDQYLLELFWQGMDTIQPTPPADLCKLPLLVIPVLNRPDLLARCLQTIDHPIETLAIVDNSRGSSAEHAIRKSLDQLEKQGHPWINQIEIARPFGNCGVAASWNMALRAFPSAAIALIANNDVQFAPGALASAMTTIQADAPQFLSLLPAPQEFSAFLITALCWNRIGLFDPSFHPAYCEDLDYRDRLRADPTVQWLRLPDLQQAMAACNQEHSATIASDPELAERNRCSFAINRLWWLSHRRLRHDPRGTWLRQWLTEWKD